MAGFEGRIGVVTGAASGIGRASARQLAAEGAHVTVSDIDRAGGEETVRLIRLSGGSADFWSADVADASQVEAMVERIVDEHGRLDFAHNNAGVCPLGYSVDTLPKEVWERVIGINLTGVWNCLKFELAVMRQQRSGAIVNTSSVSGIRGGRLASPYNASKHGVIGLTLEAAMDFAELGVRVNAVLPGMTDTPMASGLATPEVLEQMTQATPIKRPAHPDEVAAAVVWLLSDAASFVTGHSMLVDGGLAATTAPAAVQVR